MKAIANCKAGLKQCRSRRAKQRRGAMLVLICAMIFAFLMVVAFAVDIPYMHLVKSELRTATDASAKAAAEALARTQDETQAVARGIEVAARNNVAGKPLQLRASDFVAGRSTIDANGRFIFQAGGQPANSFQVAGRRTKNSLSGNVNLFFGRIFNVNSFEPEETATATFLQRDVVLVVDRSGSMNDFNKFKDLVAAVKLFASILASTPVDERVGLASYSTFATQDMDLTTDLNRLTSTLSRLPVDGFTNISDGIDAGAAIMNRGRARQFTERTMIVLTDGLQNRGRPAIDAARDFATTGTVIHAITFGQDADQDAMTDVAAIGKGRFFHAANGAQLASVFREIALTLSTMITE